MIEVQLVRVLIHYGASPADLYNRFVLEQKKILYKKLEEERLNTASNAVKIKVI
jgi:hypothetical protein